MTPQDIAAQTIVDAWRDLPFSIGKHDCAHLVQALRREIGRPVSFRGKGSYKTEAGAIRALKSLGYDTLEKACDALLGERLETPLFARMGDVVMVPGEGAISGGLGLMLNDGRIFCAAAPAGEVPVFQALGHVNQETGESMCLAAWRLV